jgi:hypothetical protein
MQKLIKPMSKEEKQGWKILGIMFLSSVFVILILKLLLQF